MKKLIKKNLGFLFSKTYFFKENKKIKKVVSILNKKKFILISWMKYSWKTKFILSLVKATNNANNTFFLNKDLDNENIINSEASAGNMLDTHISEYWKPKLIVLQNINKIHWIKDFISDLYWSDLYKIIIIWNSIKIEWVKEIEVFSPKIWNILKYDNTKNNKVLENILRFWSIEELLFIKDDYFKTFFLDSIRENIISYDIMFSYSIKNHYLFNQTITHLSKINVFISLRELHRVIESKNPNTSLATIIDYINFSINSKVLKRIYKFDIKKSHTSTNNIKYYFNDIWIRNSVFWHNLPRQISIENLIFIELQKRWYRLKSWVNWKFCFNFIATKKNKDIYIHLTNETEEIEIKKDAKKLLKIWDNNKKYLVIDKIKDYNLKKINLDWVIVIGLTNFLKEI